MAKKNGNPGSLPDQVEQLNDFLKAQGDELRAAFPRLAAAIDEWQASGRPAPTIVRVVAKVDRFRRAGVAHSREGADHPIEAFTSEQIEALLGEPNLVVTLV